MNGWVACWLLLQSQCKSHHKTSHQWAFHPIFVFLLVLDEEITKIYIYIFKSLACLALQTETIVKKITQTKLPKYVMSRALGWKDDVIFGQNSEITVIVYLMQDFEKCLQIMESHHTLKLTCLEKNRTDQGWGQLKRWKF